MAVRARPACILQSAKSQRAWGLAPRPPAVARPTGWFGEILCGRAMARWAVWTNPEVVSRAGARRVHGGPSGHWRWAGGTAVSASGPLVGVAHENGTPDTPSASGSFFRGSHEHGTPHIPSASWSLFRGSLENGTPDTTPTCRPIVGVAPKNGTPDSPATSRPLLGSSLEHWTPRLSVAIVRLPRLLRNMHRRRPLSRRSRPHFQVFLFLPSGHLPARGRQRLFFGELLLHGRHDGIHHVVCLFPKHGVGVPVAFWCWRQLHVETQRRLWRQRHHGETSIRRARPVLGLSACRGRARSHARGWECEIDGGAVLRTQSRAESGARGSQAAGGPVLGGGPGTKGRRRGHEAGRGAIVLCEPRSQVDVGGVWFRLETGKAPGAVTGAAAGQVDHARCREALSAGEVGRAHHGVVALRSEELVIVVVSTLLLLSASIPVGLYPVSPSLGGNQVNRLAVAHLFFSPNLMPKKDTIRIDD